MLDKVLAYVMEKYSRFGKPTIDVLEDDCGRFIAYAIILPDLGWEDWKKVARDVKKWMKENGLEHMTGKIAIVGLKALTEEVIVNDKC